MVPFSMSALPFFAYAHDDEVAGLAALGNQRSLDLKKEYLFRELLFSYNLVHIV